MTTSAVGTLRKYNSNYKLLTSLYVMWEWKVIKNLFNVKYLDIRIINPNHFFLHVQTNSMVAHSLAKLGYMLPTVQPILTWISMLLCRDVKFVKLTVLK